MGQGVPRAENLLGVLALVAQDTVRPAVEAGAGHRGAAAAALVHLAEYSGESAEQLTRVLRISQPGTVAVVDRLAAGGLLERRPGQDGRTRALHLTADGRRVVGEILAARESRLRELLEPLDEGERAALAGLLEKVVGGLAGDRAGARVVCRLCDRAACCAGRGCPLDHTVPPPDGDAPA